MMKRNRNCDSSDNFPAYTNTLYIMFWSDLDLHQSIQYNISYTLDKFGLNIKQEVRHIINGQHCGIIICYWKS